MPGLAVGASRLLSTAEPGKFVLLSTAPTTPQQPTNKAKERPAP